MFTIIKNNFNFRITTVYTTKEDEEKNQETEEKENNDSLDEKEMEEANEEDFDILIDFLLLLIKFLLHYAFGVYLLTIANEDSSLIISISYIIFALISFSKAPYYLNIQKYLLYSLFL